MLHSAAFLKSMFDQAMSFADFLDLADSLGHRASWDQRFDELALTPRQQSLVGDFTREMNILCLTGTWCGDCALQGSAMQRVAVANPDKIHLRFLQRSEEHADMVVRNSINAGFRVPITYFCAEDFEPVSRFGDRTLSRYRSMARKQLPPGAVSIFEPPPPDPVHAVLAEVLNEVERVQLLLRVSPRLRQRHGD